LIVVGVFCAGCSVTRQHSPSGGSVSEKNRDVLAIRAARSDQNRAIADGDARKAAEYWTEDVTMRRGLGAAVTGPMAYGQLVTRAAGGTSLVYQRVPTSVEVSQRWPLAFETGQWSGHLETVKGPTVIAGRYSAQWVKREGRWLIRSEVFVALSCNTTGCAAEALP